MTVIVQRHGASEVGALEQILRELWADQYEMT
jgi:hypothetical protein